MRKPVVLLAVLAASVTVAQAEPLKLMVGASASEGEVSFILSVTTTSSPLLGYRVSTTESVGVTTYVPGALSASEKAAVIGDAVAGAYVPGTWRAVPVPDMVAVLTFEHLVGDAWVPVDSIGNLADTTGSGTLVYTRGQAASFSLDIDPMALATGFDAYGFQSALAISVTNSLTFGRAIWPGDTADVLLTDFQNFLAAQAPQGVQFVRTSPTSLNILVSGTETAALSWQVTDTGLLGMATAGALLDVDSGQLIER